MVSVFSFVVWFELLNIVFVLDRFKFIFLIGYNIKLCLNDRERVIEDSGIRDELNCIMY